MFKISKSVLPSYVIQMFSFRPFNETLQSLRSTGALDFYTPRPQKEIFKQSSIYSGPVIWNNLPDCLLLILFIDIVVDEIQSIFQFLKLKHYVHMNIYPTKKETHHLELFNSQENHK